MKKRDIFLPSLTTLVIFVMMISLSCAHEGQVKDGMDADNTAETVVGDNTEAASPEKSQNDLSELSKTTEEGAASTQSTEPAAETGKTADSALENLDTKGPEASATPENQSAGSTPDLDAALGLPSDKDVANAGAAAQATPETAPATPEAPAATTPEVASAGPEASAATPAPEPSVPEATEPATPPVRHFGGRSRVPKIPSHAVSRRGQVLNRFYFVRKGDTAKSLSELIYSSPNKSSWLTKWNGKGWQPGQLIYYQSAIDPSDKQIRSFYQEKNVPPEEYTVQRGDWLSRIAAKKLGSSKSWKEIAVINGMDSPDKLEVGQKLAMYPRDLHGYPQEQQVSQNEKPEAPTTAKNAPVTPVQPPVETAPQQEAPPQDVPPAEPQAPVAKKVLPPASPGMDTSKLIEQNMFFIVIGAGVIILLLALMAVNKRKRSSKGEDFGDENFSPPSKLKRK